MNARLLLSTLYFVSLAFTLGCSLWQRERATIGITRDDYRTTCGQCHRVHRPGIKTDEEWRAFMNEHRFLCGMDEETAELYADYLAARN